LFGCSTPAKNSVQKSSARLDTEDSKGAVESEIYEIMMTFKASEKEISHSSIDLPTRRAIVEVIPLVDFIGKVKEMKIVNTTVEKRYVYGKRTSGGFVKTELSKEYCSDLAAIFVETGYPFSQVINACLRSKKYSGSSSENNHRTLLTTTD